MHLEDVENLIKNAFVAFVASHEEHADTKTDPAMDHDEPLSEPF